MKYESAFDLVGHTPHIRIRCPDAPEAVLYAKLEGCNPTGSVKDRAAIGMIRAAQQAGRCVPGKTLLDASSGNFACAVAYFGQLIGLPASLVVSSKITLDKRRFLEYYGAAITQLGDFTIQGNQHCRSLVAAEPERYCFLDQLHNDENPLAHYRTTGPEILATHPNLRLLVGSLGSGGTLFGAGRFIKESLPGVRVIAVQAAVGTRLPGTGSFGEGDYITPFIRDGYATQVFDDTICVEEAQAIRRTRELRAQGVFGGLQTGGVLHAAIEAARQFEITGEVLMLSGDSGWKNLDRLGAIG